MSFGITAEELVTLHSSRKIEKLEEYGGLQAVARALRTDLTKGLSTNEEDFSSRRNEFGANTYPEKKLKSIFYYVLESLKEVTLIILIIAAVVSLAFAFIQTEEKNAWLDSVGIIIAIVLVTSVTSFNNWSKERMFRNLNKEKEKRMINVMRDGKMSQVVIHDVVVGDIVKVETGDQLPADGIFVDGFNVSLDCSHLSGESKEVSCSAKNPFMPNAAKIQEGVCYMLVVAVGTNTEWGRTLIAMTTDEANETPLQAKLGTLAANIGYIGMVVAGLNFICLCIKYGVEVYRSPDLKFLSIHTLRTLLSYLVIAVTIVVVAVPEGLPLAVTISLAYSMKKMLKDNNLVRHLSACETMGSATDICSDKTGTLTTNRMQVVEAIVAEQNIDLNATSTIHADVLNTLCDAIAINSTAVVHVDPVTQIPQFLGNKTECALLYMLIKQFDIDYLAIRNDADQDKAQVYTFSSERKRMSTVVRFERELEYRIFTKGAAEIVYGLCNRHMTSDGTIVQINNEMRSKVEKEIQEMAAKGLRTLCIAFNDFRVSDEQDLAVDVPERDLILIGILGIKDPLRKEVIDSVDQCKRSGITVRMVTGDNRLTAEYIAKECGILYGDGLILEGKEFSQLSHEEKLEVAPRLQVMARSSPTDKLELVNTLKELGRVVAVTGDGTNDGPALKSAHVGLSMGLTGTEIAKEASDIVILDDNFASIVKSVLWGRSVYENIRKFLQFQLTINIVALVVTFVGSVTSQGFPLTPVQLLWINLIMDTFAALALATEPPSNDLLNRKPHGTEDYLITNDMWKNIFTQALYQVAVLLVLIYAHSYIFADEFTKRVSDKDFTLVFNVFVICQLFNEFNARRINNEMNIFSGLQNSYLFVGIMIVSVVVQVVITEFGRYIGFGTYGLSWLEWLVSIALGFMSLPIGFILRVIPTPKQGFCGMEVPALPSFTQLFKRRRDSQSHFRLHDEE